MEEAVRRETLEETGIEVGEVIYHSSQPWPGTLCFISHSVNVLVIPLLAVIVGSSFFFSWSEEALYSSYGNLFPCTIPVLLTFLFTTLISTFIYI